ncbi:MAG: amidohydrolase family protein [Acidimicrobiales bacterium]
MTDADVRIFDADNHYYESPDAFTRHVPKHLQPRCVQWVEVDGRRHHLVAGRLDRQVTNPTFNPVAKPGVLREYYRGNPEGKTVDELIRSAVEPMPPEYMDREARLRRIDEQGVEGVWLFPTLGVLYEERLKKDPEALCTTFHAFNQWVAEDWGLAYKGKIFAAPYLSLVDVDWACRELDWALDNGARIVALRPAAVFTPQGPRSPADPVFDPFWQRVHDAGITVIAHVSNSGYASNGYPKGLTFETIGGGKRPSVVSLNPERAIYDFLITLVYDRLFERFPRVRVASVENGSEFVADLLRKLGHSRNRLPRYYAEDPVALFREHVWINPFWEDDIAEVAELVGADRVIFGSDWPHVEGLARPRDVLDELTGVAPEDRDKILYANAAGLNERLPA